MVPSGLRFLHPITSGVPMKFNLRAVPVYTLGSFLAFLLVITDIASQRQNETIAETTFTVGNVTRWTFLYPNWAFQVLTLLTVLTVVALSYAVVRYLEQVYGAAERDFVSFAISTLVTIILAPFVHFRAPIIMVLAVASASWVCTFLTLKCVILPHLSSFKIGSSRRIGHWIHCHWQFFYLFFLNFFLYGGLSVTTGIAPAGDIREHIFRTLEFLPGLFAGDYTPIQYHGYAFLAGYGVLYYAITSSISSLFSPFVPGFVAATYASNLMWVFTPFVLAYGAIRVADELGMGDFKHKEISRALLGTFVLLYPGVIEANLLGADPYMLSFAFSMIALSFGLQVKDEGRSLFGFLVFAALSIYTETFGYIFVAVTFLGLSVTGKRVYKLVPALLALTAFSWVQLLEVSGFMAPYIEELPLFSLPFFADAGIMVCLVGLASYLLWHFRGRFDRRYLSLFVMALLTILLALLPVAKVSFGWNMGPLNDIADGILPWRLLFVNLPVLLLVWGASWVSGTDRVNLQKAIALASVFLISAPMFLGMYFVTMVPLPPSGAYRQFGNQTLLATGPALFSQASPVDFSPAFNYSTVTGAFSQGDPSFFSLTVYYEWTSYASNSSVVQQNLMHLTGANQAVTVLGNSDSKSSDSVLSNSSMPEAVAVTPILLEAPNSTEALQFALFANLLGKDGYRLDFVTSAPSSEIYGVVVLPGFRGATPENIPVYTVWNASIVESGRNLFPVVPYTDAPYDALGGIPNNVTAAASSLVADLTSFFHPVYSPAKYESGLDYYAAFSNYSLPIQLARSYYPYFVPYNYSQNIYNFVLLPGPEKITWHLPFYEVAAAVTVAAVLACIAFSRRVVFTSGSD